MVMIFSSEKALKHLLEHGEVVTFRLKSRKEGKDWITDRRGGKRLADIEVKLLERVSKPSQKATTFQKYLNKSGFSSVREWWDEITNLNGYYKFFEADEGYFYLIRLVEEVDPDGDNSDR